MRSSGNEELIQLPIVVSCGYNTFEAHSQARHGHPLHAVPVRHKATVGKPVFAPLPRSPNVQSQIMSTNNKA